MNLERIKAFTKKTLQDERTGHDYYHGQRVAHLAEKMYLNDNPQAHKSSRLVAIINAAGYLHDTIDEKISAEPKIIIEEIKELLAQSGFEDLEVKDILFTIQHISFSANIEYRHQLPLSGKYVQDADRLESLGAIGIARAFTYGGKHGNLIYDPQIKPVTLTDHDQYRNHEKTTINHFYEKLFNLEKLMNTSAGELEARRRTEYMRDFIKEFMNEWEV
ncbi:HD domain-containing protein [Lactobacillus sp. PV034]|nr:HD domain-containing protein [Lactobacillus sp. PV034]QNQ81528.1 HD domain-containing protein [Lactobacillus sp. PV034]